VNRKILTSYLRSFTDTNYGLFSLPKAVYLNEYDNVSVDMVASITCNKFKSRYVSKMYNHLKTQIKQLSTNVVLFKTALKKFLLHYVFYIIDEYYQQNYNDYAC